MNLPNALTLLRTDHENVQELFDRFEKQKEKGTARQLQELAQQIKEKSEVSRREAKNSATAS